MSAIVKLCDINKYEITARVQAQAQKTQLYIGDKPLYLEIPCHCLYGIEDRGTYYAVRAKIPPELKAFFSAHSGTDALEAPKALEDYVYISDKTKIFSGTLEDLKNPFYATCLLPCFLNNSKWNKFILQLKIKKTMLLPFGSVIA